MSTQSRCGAHLVNAMVWPCCAADIRWVRTGVGTSLINLFPSGSLVRAGTCKGWGFGVEASETSARGPPPSADWLVCWAQDELGACPLKDLGTRATAAPALCGGRCSGSLPPRSQALLLGDRAGRVSLTDFCEPSSLGGAETMAPLQGPRAPLEFGGPLGNEAEIGDLRVEAERCRAEGVN